MILDNNLKTAEVALSSGDSATDVFDLAKGGDVVKTPLTFIFRGTVAGAGGTSAVLSVQTSDSEDFSSYDTLAASGTILTANLTAKELYKVAPRGLKRYVRGYIDTTGTFTAGKIEMFVVDGDQVN